MAENSRQTRYQTRRTGRVASSSTVADAGREYIDRHEEQDLASHGKRLAAASLKRAPCDQTWKQEDRIQFQGRAGHQDGGGIAGDKPPEPKQRTTGQLRNEHVRTTGGLRRRRRSGFVIDDTVDDLEMWGQLPSTSEWQGPSARKRRRSVSLEGFVDIDDILGPELPGPVARPDVPAPPTAPRSVSQGSTQPAGGEPGAPSDEHVTPRPVADQQATQLKRIHAPEAYSFIGSTLRALPAEASRLFGSNKRRRIVGGDSLSVRNGDQVVTTDPRQRYRCADDFFCCGGCIPRWLFHAPAVDTKDLGPPDPNAIRITNAAHTEDITDRVLAYFSKRAVASKPLKLTVRFWDQDETICLPTTSRLPPRPSPAVRMHVRREWAKFWAIRGSKYDIRSSSSTVSTPVTTPEPPTPGRSSSSSLLNQPAPLQSTSAEFAVVENGRTLVFQFAYRNMRALDSDVHAGKEYENVYVTARHSEWKAPAASPWLIEIPYLDDTHPPKAPQCVERVFVVLKNFAPWPTPCWWFDPNEEVDIQPFVSVGEHLLRGMKRLKEFYRRDLKMGNRPSNNPEVLMGEINYYLRQPGVEAQAVEILNREISVTTVTSGGFGPNGTSPVQDEGFESPAMYRPGRSLTPKALWRPMSPSPGQPDRPPPRSQIPQHPNPQANGQSDGANNPIAINSGRLSDENSDEEPLLPHTRPDVTPSKIGRPFENKGNDFDQPVHKRRKTSEDSPSVSY
jgi:hypothetical protein